MLKVSEEKQNYATNDLFHDESEENNDFSFKYNHDNLPLTEEWSRIEERCHISSSKIELKDITYKTMENNILATNHIILCGLVPNLINFVIPLRSKYLSKYPPIVILHEFKPTEK